jgi:hypothetical protein
MNRNDRRTMKKRLAPIARRIVELEKQAKTGINVEAAQSEIAKIMEELSLVEMMALEDYIYSKKLLDK